MSALTPGTRIGPYEVVAPLGAGGMGEVYRARDTRLDRIVAIKVLSSALAEDAQGRERLEREARAISSLNHPNICVLYDVGREGPIDFLVMEYLEGETLAARIARLPMTIEDALAIAIQVASALDKAHGQGIVHRDLKPGNVMLTKPARPGATSTSMSASGAHVKLLDFGLARLTGAGQPAGGELARGLVSLADLSMPTMSSPLTMKGAILGTLHYMAPEQLEGREVDARADIFAFGVLLYEMLTGRRPFEGKSQASLIGAILDQSPPPLASAVPAPPPLLEELVARCLAKDRDNRWQSARDLTRQLEWISTHAAYDAGAAARTGQRGGRTRLLRLAAALGAAGTIAGVVAAWTLWPKATAPPAVSRFTIELPTDQTLTRTGRRGVALSPDGSRLAYVANQQIYVRPLNELTATAVSGTAATDPSEPVFSPDGQWLAFWSRGQIRKVPVTGGTPVALVDAVNPYGMSWDGDRLLFGQDRPGAIVAIRPSGGPPERLVTLGENDVAQSPQLLAGGTAILYTLRAGNIPWDDADIVVENLKTRVRTALVKGGTHGRVLPTGHLVYARESTLFAVAFDEATLSVSGGVVPVQQNIELGTGGFSGAAQVVWSNQGSMLFVPTTTNGDRALMWMDRQGRTERTTAPVRRYQLGSTQLRLSPDGTRAAMTVVTQTDRLAGADIWIWEIARGTLSRLSQVSNAESPVWTSDSRRVCYQETTRVYCQIADGSSPAESMFSLGNLVNMGPVTADGRQVLLHTRGAATLNDIVLADLSSSPNVRPLIQTPAIESQPTLSPDGRWLMYASNESGQPEVYVRPFPDVNGGRWQISSGGGTDPRWSRTRPEVYFLDASGSQGSTAVRGLMAVTYVAGATFTPSAPVRLAALPTPATGSYDVAADGRFLLTVPLSFADGSPQPRQQLVIVQHWFEELRSRVPATR